MTFHQARLLKALGFPSVMDALAWDIATAVSDFPVEADVVPSLVIDRIIDTAALAALALGWGKGGAARNRAILHPSPSGAGLFGASAACLVSPEWAAWASGVILREASGCHDALTAGYPRPGDVIPPLMAVAQSLRLSGCRPDPGDRHRLRCAGGAGGTGGGGQTSDRSYRTAWTGCGEVAPSVRTVRRQK